MPANLMFNKITVSRPTYGQDAAFGQTTSASNIYTNIGANIQPANSKIIFFYQQRNLEVTHTIFVDTSVVIHNGDTITDGTNTFRVNGVRNLISLNRVWAIDCVVYQP